MSILLEQHGRIVELTLNRPDKLNAMDWETYSEVTEALRRLDGDDSVRAIIITGAGDRAFSAGADLKLMHNEDEVTEQWRPWRNDRWDFGMPCSKPMIAAVNGYCLAGALELALACDIRISSPNGQFGAPEVKWNLLHGFGALRLPQVVGLSNAMEMLLTGEFISAERALAIGLVSRVVPAKELLPTARAIAEKIAQNGPLAVAMTKELTLRGLDTPIESSFRLYRSYYDQIARTEDQRIGLKAFAEKKSPDFSGR